jgi:hypothetical protein
MEPRSSSMVTLLPLSTSMDPETRQDRVIQEARECQSQGSCRKAAGFCPPYAQPRGSRCLLGWTISSSRLLRQRVRTYPFGRDFGP